MHRDSKAAPQARQWRARLPVGLTVVLFGSSAFFKLTSNPAAVEGFGRIGIPGEALVPIGVVELLCLALYVIPRTTILGTLLLTGYLGGAVLANIVGGTDFLHALAVGAVVWGGAWMRVPEFRKLIPFLRKPVVDEAAPEGASEGLQSLAAQAPERWLE